MRRTLVLFGALALWLTIGTAQAGAQEEAVPQGKIPKAVMDALLAKFPGAVIAKCTKAKEGGDVVYDIEFKQDGRNCEADIKENGAYINFEKAIAASALPRAVSDAIQKRYPGSTMREIMEETEVNGKDEKRAAYEVVLMTAGKKEVEVKVSPDGKILEDSGAKAEEKK